MTPFLRIIHSSKTRLCLCLSFVLTLCFVGQADAGPSFTITLSFYQGVDVTTGITELDPTVLTVVFGDAGEVEIVLEPEIANPFDFSPAVDFYFGYEPGAEAPFLFNPSENIIAMAVLDGPLIGDPEDVLGDPFEASVASDDFILFKTSESDYFIFRDVSSWPDLLMSMTVEAFQPAVPEPSALLLLGLGLIGIMGITRRKILDKKKQENKGNMGI